MAKLNLTTVGNLSGQETTAISTINNNNEDIEDAIENTLSRDGTSPNQMEADFDLNGNDILNGGTAEFEEVIIDGTGILEILEQIENTNANQPVYRTNDQATEANAAETLTVGRTFKTLGKTAEADNGGSEWIVTSSNPSNTLKLNLNGSGKYARSIEKVLRPEQFGVTFDGSTDDENGWIDLSAEMNWRAANNGSCRVEFPDYKISQIHNTGIDNAFLFDLGTGLGPFYINWNGSIVETDDPFVPDAGGLNTKHAIVGIRGHNIKGLVVNDFNMRQLNNYDYTTDPNSLGATGGGAAVVANQGIFGAQIGGASKGIIFNRYKQFGGQNCVNIVPFTSGNTFDSTDPAQDVHVDYDIDYVFYGPGGSYNGNNMYFRGHHGHAGRMCINYNVQNVEHTFTGTPGPWSSNKIVFGINVDSSASDFYNSFRHIKVRGSIKDSDDMVNQSHLIAFVIINSTGGETDKAIFDDLDVKVHVESAGYTPGIIQTSKIFNGSFDNSARNYTFNDIKIHVTGDLGGSSDVLGYLFDTGASAGTWSSDTGLRNIELSFDLGTSTSGTLEVDNIVDNLTFKDCNVPSATLSITDGTGTINTVGKVNFANFDSAGTWTPSLTFTTPGDLSVSYTTRLGTYRRLGDTVYCEFDILTSAFTHTTASGSFIITGFPFANRSDMISEGSGIYFQGITKTNYTQFVPQLAASATSATIIASGSGQSASTVSSSDVPTGTTKNIRGTFIYKVKN